MGWVVAGVMLTLIALPLFRGQVYVYCDLAYGYLPMRWFFADCLAKGEDPSWCPNLFGGFFVTGEGGGTYHPWIRLLYSTLSLGPALNFELLVSYPALLVGFIVLATRWGMRRDAALFGALVFALGGYNMLHFMHMNVLAMLAHVPWLLLAIDVTLRAQDRRQVALARVFLSLLTASQIVMGHVQFAWISGVCEASYGLVLAWQVPGAARRLPGLAVSKALGILGGAIQIAPLWESFQASKRVAPTAAYVAMGSLSPWNLIQWVAPYLTVSRVITPPMAIDGGILPPAPSMLDWRVHEFSLYYGAAIPALLVWLAANRKGYGRLRPLILFAGIMTVAGFVLALGDYTPLYQITSKIPVVGRFRIAARYLVLFHLGVALLAAVAFSGLCGVADRSERPAWRRLWPLAVPPLLSILACLATRLPEGLWPAYIRGEFVAATPLMLAGPALIAVATALVACAARGSRIALLALFVFIGADQTVYAFQLRNLIPPQTIAEYLAARPLPPGGDTSVRVKFNQLRDTWHNAYIMKGLRTMSGYSAMTPRQRLDYSKHASLRVAGVGWVMPSDDERGQPWIPLFGPLPRARLVTQTQRSDDPNRDIETIDVAITALVGRDLPLPPATPGAADLVGDRPGKIDVMTTTESKQLLVLSETNHRGWRVKVDGKTQPILRVYGDFMGCVVPQGRHHVQFRFQSSSVRAGFWLSTLGLVLMTAVPLAPLWPRARPTTPGGRIPHLFGNSLSSRQHEPAQAERSTESSPLPDAPQPEP
ncbi:YfhO family protein [Singulisphaera sp. GP187]|uniref:YfhO family protein n=1 Tax=Singulisphaera sp. GP187 TaxID=1882752 RepID=UPI0020B1571D|nr:YfhO family protein [Singulisphaera sp. GP187]